MISQGHLIWIGLSAVLIAAGLPVCLRRRPPLRHLLKICLIIGAASEIIKFFSCAVIIPMVDPAVTVQNGAAALEWLPSGEYTPYLGMEHMPLELCSLYLLFMLLALALKDGPWKKGLYAVMFASGTIGGIMGIVLSSIAGNYDTTAAFFTSVRAWQFFLYHAMVVTVSLYIGLCEESGLAFADWKKAILGILFLDLPSFYFNSVFTNAIYVHGELIGATHRINFFRPM